jgi:HlyD family secretion protein
VRAAQAQAAAQAVHLDKLAWCAPRDGLVDSLPYQAGRPGAGGSPLADPARGDAPYARIYVPEQQRANVHVGDCARCSSRAATGD